jgi:hypothetical protein
MKLSFAELLCKGKGMVSIAAPMTLALQGLFFVVPASAEEPAFKLTTGLLFGKAGEDPSSRAIDVNLRHTSRYGTVWLGWFRQPDPDVALDMTQGRVGWDNTFDVGAFRVQPSIQAASAGFWGGSLNVETGATIHPNWYAGAGLGRTNLRPYVNLNYDPNDALMASGGYRWSAHESVGVQWVRDNRDNPEQRHLHLIYRTGLAESQRLTLDVLSKSGNVTNNAGDTFKINKLGASITYDWREHFVRLAYDPKVNFSNQDMLRVSAGTRF